MNNDAVGWQVLRTLAGQGLVYLCWATVVALAYAAWQRRRKNDAANLLIAGGLWLTVRVGLLVAGLPRAGQPGGDCLATALDLTGLLLLAWPFLAPPLATCWADRLAGIGLAAVAFVCSLSLWQWIRGMLGLSPTFQFTITWAHTALVLAGLAALNLLHVRTRRPGWWLTGIVALLAGIAGLLVPLSVPSLLSSILTVATATFAAAWLNWLERPQRPERPQRKIAPAMPASTPYPDSQSRALVHLVRRQEQEAKRLRAILDGLPDGVIISNANDRVILTNRAALEILGLERSEVIGNPFGHIIDGMRPAYDVDIVKMLIDPLPSSVSVVFEATDRIVQTRMAPVKNNGGPQAGVVTVMRDVTAQTKAEAEKAQRLADLQERNRQLEDAVEQLQTLNQLKSQFITHMSHELRTPLNSILGFSGMMLKGIEGSLTEAQSQDVEAIHTSGKHLLRLITDMLEISQLWTGKLDLTLSDVNLPEIIESAMAIAAPLVGDRPIELRQALAPNLPAVRADKTRVRQVLLNLLTNAAKYTERGQIAVSAARDGNHIVIRVADTGIGIPSEHLETIFEESCRVDRPGMRPVDGLGLGLSISRQLVELQGGRIWVESKVGVGSTFYFSLPIEGPSSNPADRQVIRQQLEVALAQWQ